MPGSGSGEVNGSSTVDSTLPIDWSSALPAGNSKSSLGEGIDSLRFSPSSCFFGAKVKLNSRSCWDLEKGLAAACALSTDLSGVSADSSSKVCLHREQRNAGFVSFTSPSATL